MRKYPKYKASGVDWLGEIPSDWQCMKIKRLTVVKRGASPRPIEDSKYFDENGEFAWVRIADVTASERYLENTTQRLSKLGSSLSVKRYPGDLFLSIAATVGKPIITKVKCCIHDGFVWFPFLKTNPEFLYFLFSTGLPYQGLGKMGTQLNLNTDTVGDIYLPIPPDKEIFSIVQFLDHKTGQIDRFIANRQKQIELLKEQKAAIINKAVTKGINPNAKMKDSGIEWLPEVPETWEVWKMKFLTRIETGNKNTDDAEENGEYPFYVRSDKVERLSTYSFDGEAILTAGDGVGVAKVFHYANCKMAIHQRVYKIFHFKRVLGEFLYYYIRDNFYKEVIKLSAKTTVDSLRMPMLANFPVAYPSIEEQKEILKYIKEETTTIDTLISKYQKQIDLMLEYRTALISQAVTGKIDVRDWKPKKRQTI